MIEENAIVRTIEKEYVLVEPQRKNHCGGCSANSGCGMGALSRLTGTRAISMRLRRTMDLKVGDRVVIGLDESVLSRLSLLGYLLPILSMIGGAILVGRLGGMLHAGLIEPLAIIGGLGGLAGGLYWLRGYMARVQCSPAVNPVLLRRADEQVVGIDVSGLEKTG